VAFVFNYTSGTPLLARSSSLVGGLANANLAAASLRFATNGTGTSLPSTITPGSNASTQFTFWAALA
jgi:hypothetical protein